jgi:aspartokinase-like uncharacterized kinase
MPSADPSAAVVVKVGGSLYDLPDLGSLLGRWLDELAAPAVLVPGGGPVADVVRDLDHRHRLGEEAAHWLALHALMLNAYFLAALLRERKPAVTGAIVDWPGLWQRGMLPVVDAYAFARADEVLSDHLPHCWQATSDSVAARVALVAGARRLVLLKSVTIPAGVPWEEAARQGAIDPLFAQVLHGAVEVRAVNLRTWQPGFGNEHTPPGPAPAPDR